MEKWDTSRRLGDIMRDVLRDEGTSRRLLERRTASLWGQIVGPTVLRATRSVRVDKGVLHLAFDSSVVRERMRDLKPQLIQAINEAVGEEAIHDIMFH